jgi:glycosyltransferase
MKISLLTPTYNSAQTLARTIDSVIAQKYEDLEYIIFDGNSADNTRQIVDSYKTKININFISEKDDGLYDAMNKGLKAATGDIVGILNSDDFFDNDQVLKNVSQKFEETNTDIVYGDIVYFSEDTNKITRKWTAGKYNEKLLDNGWTIPHPALFVKKEIYEKYGYYKENYKIAADYEFILRLLKVHKVNLEYIPKVFVRMYDSGTSAKNIQNRKIGWEELKKAWADNNLKMPKFFILRRLLYKISQFILK